MGWNINKTAETIKFVAALMVLAPLAIALLSSVLRVPFAILLAFLDRLLFPDGFQAWQARRAMRKASRVFERAKSEMRAAVRSPAKGRL